MGSTWMPVGLDDDRELPVVPEREHGPFRLVLDPIGRRQRGLVEQPAELDVHLERGGHAATLTARGERIETGTRRKRRGTAPDLRSPVLSRRRGPGRRPRGRPPDPRRPRRQGWWPAARPGRARRS